jgi:hypothetical protein
MFLNNVELNRTMLLGLVGECPKGKPLSGCKLKAYRLIPLVDAEKLIQNLPEPEVEQLIQCCKDCLQDRFNGRET